MTTDVAERLRQIEDLTSSYYSIEWMDRFIALIFDIEAQARAAGAAAERERIRAALERIASDLPGEDFRGVYAILDAEAAR